MINMNFLNIKFYILAAIIIISGCNIKKESKIDLNTQYGNFEISEPILIDLINHPYMQRLKKVRQYGVSHFVITPCEYNRFDHSIGVFLLLRKHGASLNEQIAGLLHDVSHTVFSHVGDWIFKHEDGKSSYQDDIHEEFLRKYGIEDTLKKYGLSASDIHHKKNNFLMMERDIPELCADRIEYILQAGLIENLITEKEFFDIEQNLKYKDGNWFFTDAALARKFADIAIYNTLNVWGAPDGLLVYHLTGKALRCALKIGYLSMQDIEVGTDDIIWDKINRCPDEKVKNIINETKNYKKAYLLSNKNSQTKLASTPTSSIESEIRSKIQEAIPQKIKCKSKFRGVDPLVLINGHIKKLTEIDPDYKSIYEKTKSIKSQDVCFIKI